MGFDVMPEDKIVCVWSDEVPCELLNEYRMKGYRIAYFVRGPKPLKEVFKEIILPRV